MPQEHVFSDFSAGMNASEAVDKLDPRECLLAENVRLDEIGNVLSAGALSTQNTSAYAAGTGSNVNNVHSLHWNPSVGAVAGVGQDVFTGLTLGGMSSALAAKNAALQKMSFTDTPGRIFFDVGTVGYWTDLVNLLTVDWPPPVAEGSTVTGPTTVGTGVDTAAGGQNVAWTNPNNAASTSSLAFAVASFTGVNTNAYSHYLRSEMSTNSFSVSTVGISGIGVTAQVRMSTFGGGAEIFASLLINGVPSGHQRFMNPIPPIPAGGAWGTYTAGGSSDLWGLTSVTQAQANSGTFGVQFFAVGSYPGGDAVSVYDVQLTVYQGAGFVAAAGAAGTLTGTYTWKITFVDSIGEESDASSDSNAVALSGNQGTLTAIQVGDSRTTARNIYRKGGLLTAHYLVGTIQDNVSTTYADNQTDIAALAQGTILSGDVPGDYPNTRFNNADTANGFGRFPAYHYDRLFWINPGTNEFYWSKPLNAFAYPAPNFIKVGDSKPLTRVVSIFGELIIIKTDSIWRLTGTDESSFDLSPTPSAVGTDEPFAVWPMPDKIVFANRWGLWAFNGYTSTPLTTKLDLWFRQDDRTGASLFGVNGFHPPEVTSATVPLGFEMVGNSEKLYLSYAEAGQSANNAMLRFDMKTGAIAKRVAAVPLSLAIDPVNGFVYQGDSAGFVSLLDDWNGATQKGAAGNFDFQTSYFDLQRGSNKSVWALEFFLNTNGQSLTPIVYYDNGASNEALQAISATGLQRIVRPLESSASRKCQNFSVRLNGSVNPINVTGVPQIQIVHIKPYFDIRTGRARTGQ